MAKEAERLLAGSGWLPEPLRLADVEAADAEQGGEAEGLPKFLADEETAEATDGEDEVEEIIAAE